MEKATETVQPGAFELWWSNKGIVFLAQLLILLIGAPFVVGAGVLLEKTWARPDVRLLGVVAGLAAGGVFWWLQAGLTSLLVQRARGIGCGIGALFGKPVSLGLAWFILSLLGAVLGVPIALLSYVFPLPMVGGLMLVVLLLLGPCLSFIAPLIRCAGRGPWAAIRESFSLTSGYRAGIFIKVVLILVLVALQALFLNFLHGQINYGQRGIFFILVLFCYLFSWFVLCGFPATIIASAFARARNHQDGTTEVARS